MDHLTLALLCAMAVISAPAKATDLAEWTDTIFDVERRFGMPAARIEAVLRIEIADENTLVSSKGAMGLMQIMPVTRAELRAGQGLDADPFAQNDNILAGAAYLRAMHGRFGFLALFAAYNAGPPHYQAHSMTGEPLPAETRAFVSQTTRILAETAPPDAAFERQNTSPMVRKSVAVSSGRGLFFPFRRCPVRRFPRRRAACLCLSRPPIMAPIGRYWKHKNGARRTIS